MVYLLVPLDISYKNHHKGAGLDANADEERASNSIANRYTHDIDAYTAIS
jgi:hypothetical protein